MSDDEKTEKLYSSHSWPDARSRLFVAIEQGHFEEAQCIIREHANHMACRFTEKNLLPSAFRAVINDFGLPFGVYVFWCALQSRHANDVFLSWLWDNVILSRYTPEYVHPFFDTRTIREVLHHGGGAPAFLWLFQYDPETVLQHVGPATLYHLCCSSFCDDVCFSKPLQQAFRTAIRMMAEYRQEQFWNQNHITGAAECGCPKQSIFLANILSRVLQNTYTATETLLSLDTINILLGAGACLHYVPPFQTETLAETALYHCRPRACFAIMTKMSADMAAGKLSTECVLLMIPEKSRIGDKNQEAKHETTQGSLVLPKPFLLHLLHFAIEITFSSNRYCRDMLKSLARFLTFEPFRSMCCRVNRATFGHNRLAKTVYADMTFDLVEKTANKVRMETLIQGLCAIVRPVRV